VVDVDVGRRRHGNFFCKIIEPRHEAYHGDEHTDAKRYAHHGDNGLLRLAEQMHPRNFDTEFQGAHLLWRYQPCCTINAT
jgi:hypothetical protein